MSLNCNYQRAYCSSLTWYMSMENHGGMILRGKPEELGEKPVPVPLCQPQIKHGAIRARTGASVVTGRRLTASATLRPILTSHIILEIKLLNCVTNLLEPPPPRHNVLICYQSGHRASNRCESSHCAAKTWGRQQEYCGKGALINVACQLSFKGKFITRTAEHSLELKALIRVL
jgi:hypothetical protein